MEQIDHDHEREHVSPLRDLVVVVVAPSSPPLPSHPCYRLPVPQAVLGLGSNLGARRALMRCALALLSAQPGLTVLARSQLYETPPLGPPQPDYLNAAVRIAWAGGLEGLFQICQHVEHLLGRERRERWGARTLDLDLLHWSEGPRHSPYLDVPHLELAKRPFALAPLLDVQPELDPIYGATLRQLGGAPKLAHPSWLDLSRSPEPDPPPEWLMARAHGQRGRLTREQPPLSLRVPRETPEDELACLAVSAVGACARTPRTARASLLFALAPCPPEHGTSLLLTHVQRLAIQGFRATDAAIIGADEAGIRGYVIGEHSGASERCASPRVLLAPADGPTRTLWAFPPSDP